MSESKNIRSTKFTPEVCDAIIADLSEGVSRACAAECAGVAVRTLMYWMSKGKKGEEPYVAFFAQVKRAERQAEREIVKSIVQQSKKFWQAGAWWLERKYPETWSKDTEIIKEFIAELRKRKKESEPDGDDE